MGEEGLQPAARRGAVQHGRAAVRAWHCVSGSAVITSRNLFISARPTVVVPLWHRAEPVPLAEVGGDFPGDVGVVRAERRGIGKAAAR